MKRLALVLSLAMAASAHAVPFTITITNTSNVTAYDWSTGLLTLSPLITLGRTPRPGTPEYATYTFANSDCNVSDSFCGRGCSDNGNASVLAARRGLSLGTNAWLVPSIPANGGSATVTIDAPPGSRLSYIAWVNDTGVFDDFVAMHPYGDAETLSVPLFDGNGNPLTAVDFVIGGYDSNSTDPDDGSGDTCTPACPTAANRNCYVAVGNASQGASGNFPAPAASNINRFTVVSGENRNTLRWSSPPAAPHGGVVVVRRAGSAVTATLSNGNQYTAGQNLGGGQSVVYAGADETFVDTGLTNGTQYFYKVYGRASGVAYGNGAVPASTGLWAIPTSKASGSPQWCYSVGFPALQQPTTQLGVGIFSASNGTWVTANRTSPGANDGLERFRPVALQGPSQNRPTLLPLQGGVSRLIVGDQTGRVYAIDPDSGSLAWTSAFIGNAVQGQPVAQLRAYSNAAYQAAQSRDLIFAASRNSSSTNNRVVALDAATGATVWTYLPTGNNTLDIVNGGMAVDYERNRLWVASRNNGGNRPSLRVINTLTGAQVATFNVGNVDSGVNLRFVGNAATEVVLINTGGTAYGFSLANLTQVWSVNIGAATNWIWPINTGFIASLQAGRVAQYTVVGTSATQTWSASIAMPTGITIDYATQKAFVGSSTTGRLYQLSLDTGAIEGSVLVPGTTSLATLGQPTFDSSSGRVHIGTNNGLCAFSVPLP